MKGLGEQTPTSTFWKTNKYKYTIRDEALRRQVARPASMQRGCPSRLVEARPAILYPAKLPFGSQAANRASPAAVGIMGYSENLLWQKHRRPGGLTQFFSSSQRKCSAPCQLQDSEQLPALSSRPLQGSEMKGPPMSSSTSSSPFMLSLLSLICALTTGSPCLRRYL